MKQIIFILVLIFFSIQLYAQKKKDSCYVGIYLKSLYDLSPSDFSFGADFYIWSNSTDGQNLFQQFEIINAKQIDESSYFKDVEDNAFINYENCKAQLTHEWKLKYYPFDKQQFRISIEAQNPVEFSHLDIDENSFQISRSMKVPGWNIKRHYIEKKYTTYPSDFGYKKTEVSDRRFNHLSFVVELSRNSLGLYLKLFSGLYIAFLVSFLAFFIRPDYVDPRFGLSIGGLFASVANKYVVDANIPATIGFSFVDMVHFVAFIAILVTLVSSAFSLRLFSKGLIQRQKMFDNRASVILATSYVVINIILILIAGV